jgi:hypothetical protein
MTQRGIVSKYTVDLNTILKKSFYAILGYKTNGPQWLGVFE